MRRLISFVLAIALLAAGLYLLFLQLFVSSRLNWHALDAAGALITLGACWLWEDFIGPWLRGDGPTLTPATPGCTMPNADVPRLRWEARDPGERLRGGQLSKGTMPEGKNPRQRMETTPSMTTIARQPRVRAAVLFLAHHVRRPSDFCRIASACAADFQRSCI
jgi:hypothetical protein